MRWIDPFLASLRRHRILAALISVQAAIAAMLLVLGVARIGELQARLQFPSGLDEAQILQVRVAGHGDAIVQAREQQALARLPGVVAVARINQLPFGAEGWNSEFGIRPARAAGTMTAAVYLGDRGLTQALGLRMMDGRDFNAAEYPATPMQGTGYAQARHALLSQAMAEKLFPAGGAVGRTVYFGRQPLQVVGVMAGLQGRDPMQSSSLILPLWRRDSGHATYVLRLGGSMPDSSAVAAVVGAQAGRRVVDVRSVAQLRRAWFVQDRIGQWMLAIGLVLWLAGTGAGTANISDLLLQARLRQIGIRRALGARSGQIRWQLRRENLLLTGGGAGLGLLVLTGLWHVWPWLDARLPIPTAAQCLLAWLLLVATGQLALWPITHEADAVSPTLASRRA
ncbi:MAG TPA: ABC transporter permease [Stenotrophomonas sp.]|jgi:putative ABC transport system permease protein